jgi:hypothetical protein
MQIEVSIVRSCYCKIYAYKISYKIGRYKINLMKKILIIGLLSTLLIACKKDKGNTNPIEIKYSAEGLAYVQLSLNKYFIYRDSSTGILDSVVVTQSGLERIFSPNHVSTGPSDRATPDFYYQTFTLTLTKYNGASQQDWFYGTASNNLSLFMLNSTTNASLFLMERNRLNNTDKNYVFHFPYSISQVSNISVIILPSIMIEGKNYLNVIIHSTSNGSDPTNINFIKSTYYWVKGIGIVKREIKTSNSVKTEILVRNG